MKKFVAIYMAPHEAIEKMMKSMTPEDSGKQMKVWQDWMAKHKASFVDEGAPLGKNMRVSSEGAKPTRNDINGFSVVQANSLEEAAEIFKDNPQMQMPGSYVEVLEWVNMGM